jgi:hypothetical protein
MAVPQLARARTTRPAESRRRVRTCSLTASGTKGNGPKIRTTERRGVHRSAPTAKRTRRRFWNDAGSEGRRIRRIGKENSNVNASGGARMCSNPSIKFPWSSTTPWWSGKPAYAPFAAGSRRRLCVSTIATTPAGCAASFAAAAIACSVLREMTRSAWKREANTCALSGTSRLPHPILAPGARPSRGRRRQMKQAFNAGILVLESMIPKKWEPVFGKRSCSNKEAVQNDHSRTSHPGPANRFHVRTASRSRDAPRSSSCRSMAGAGRRCPYQRGAAPALSGGPARLSLGSG